MKVCKTCNQEKPVDQFPAGKGYKNGIRPHCNSGIGNLRDDIGLLQRAIAYLESTQG